MTLVDIDTVFSMPFLNDDPMYWISNDFSLIFFINKINGLVFSSENLPLDHFKLNSHHQNRYVC